MNCSSFSMQPIYYVEIRSSSEKQAKKLLTLRFLASKLRHRFSSESPDSRPGCFAYTPTGHKVRRGMEHLTCCESRLLESCFHAQLSRAVPPADERRPHIRGREAAPE